MIELTCLRALSDNYIWMLDDGRDAVVVDPGEAAPVQAALSARGLRLAGILLTHHHGDHVAGVAALASRRPIPVYGPAHGVPAIAGVTRPVDDGAVIEVLGLRFTVLAVPGHTLDHIAYHGADIGNGGVLFCGDTLFSAGCGRLFEGSAAQMQASLRRLAALPDATRVCCAHEYTLANLAFALSIEPDNAALISHAVECRRLRIADQPTVPTTLALERRINPFLRCTEPTVIDAVADGGGRDALAVFTRLRRMKDDFRVPAATLV